jgi:hypothetical protein
MLSTLTPRSSGENGLVTNSAAPSRCARSNVEKSPRAERDHRHPAQVGVGAHGAQELEGVERGQIEVEEHDLRPAFAQQPERAGIAEALADGEAVGEVSRELLAKLGVVVDDGHRLLLHARQDRPPAGPSR